MRITTIAALVAGISLTLACTNVQDYSIHADGFGPIRLGIDVKNLPASLEGLYDCIVPEHIEEYDWEGTVYHLTKAGQKIATITDDEGHICVIELFSNALETTSGLSLHSSVADLFAHGGRAYCDNSGYWGIICEGLLFSGMELTPIGQQKAENAYLDSTEQIFTESDYLSGTRPVQITLTEWYSTMK